jgi:uncharacterized protein
VSTIDPRAPLVVDIRELGRRPGAMRRVHRSVPAPADLGLGGVIGVPEGAEVVLDLRLESVVEGVLVSGTARAPLAGECVRCLDPVDAEIVVDLQELFAFPERVAELGADAEDDAELQVRDDHVDLEPALRDAVVLALPPAPVCRDDCPGLCPECGFRFADDPAHGHDAADPRWAALTGLLAATGTTGAAGATSAQRPRTDDLYDRSATGSDGAGPTKES